MEPEIISFLQPKFCSRAALLQVQEKLNKNLEMDCQLFIRFSDGSHLPLPTKRKDIETLLSEQLSTIEQEISETIDASIDGSTDTPD